MDGGAAICLCDAGRRLRDAGCDTACVRNQDVIGRFPRGMTPEERKSPACHNDSQVDIFQCSVTTQIPEA